MPDVQLCGPVHAIALYRWSLQPGRGFPGHLRYQSFEQVEFTNLIDAEIAFAWRCNNNTLLNTIDSEESLAYTLSVQPP